MSVRGTNWFGAAVLAGVALAGALYATSACSTREHMLAHNLAQQTTRRPQVIAHRGGAGLWPENTIYAFERAHNLGADAMELDVQSTADGVLVVMHDAAVDRTTDGTGRVNEMTLARLKKLDAGFRWSADGGKTYPYRGRGLTVPTLEEVFTRLPGMRFIIEPKQEQPSLAQPLCHLIREKGMGDKIIVGSFRQAVLDDYRAECPGAATSASPAEVGEFLRAFQANDGARYTPKMRALQVPEYVGGLHVLTSAFVEAARAKNLQVQAWTVNETEAMRRLIELGVDGIMTDYPDRLMKLLGPTPGR